MPDEGNALPLYRKAVEEDHDRIDAAIKKASRTVAVVRDNAETAIPLGFLTGKNEDMDVQITARSQSHALEGDLNYLHLHPLKLTARASNINKYFFVGGLVEIQEPKVTWM